MQTIFHIAQRAEWEQAAPTGAYRPASLASEGFIHCSTAAQVPGVANAFYRGQGDLLLLVIDPARLHAPLREEPPAEDPASEARFPHIYGPLNVDAVVRVVPFVPDAAGRFSLPPDAL
jgi:uncharacterized protein (DUF952 family)